ncbi:MAG: hypothetical protein DRJ68_06895 [Thermoprotei archaeon]|nr:MAG: hypothetical protein DRJ68_06895 [Thermoprotei archaeon]
MAKGGGLLEGLAAFSYRVLKPKSNEPYFPFIKDSFLTAQINVPFPAYTSAIVVLTVIVGVVATVVSFFVHFFILKFPLMWSILLTAVWGILGAAATLASGVYYPSLKSKSLAHRINLTLPYVVEYMAALAAGGASIETLLKRIAEVEKEKALKGIFGFALKNMKLFNMDPVLSLLEAAKRSPSAHLRNLLQGLATVIASSGDIASYLSEFAKSLVDLRRNSLRRVLTSMGYITEVYVALVVVGPAILITMMLIVTLLGYSLFGFDPTLLTMLMTFLGIPFLSALMLIIMDRTLSSV